MGRSEGPSDFLINFELVDRKEEEEKREEEGNEEGKEEDEKEGARGDY